MDLHFSRKLLSNINLDLQKEHMGPSLVVLWIRIHQSTHGTQVQSLSRKIPHVVEQLRPCATATEPELQSPQTTTLSGPHAATPVCHNYGSLSTHTPRDCALQQEKSLTTMRSPSTATESSPHQPQPHKAQAKQRRPSTAPK